MLGLALLPVAAVAEQATPPKSVAATDDETVDGDVVSMAAYNVKADQIEDFGLRVDSAPYPKANPGGLKVLFSKFAPIITAVVPNTAADRAGLLPGERVLKSEGRSTVGSGFSLGKSGQWHKTQQKKWAEVAAGNSPIVWTLEVETPWTKTVRTVKLVVPTPAPRWGASIWRAPFGREPSTVTEPGPLAERSRAVLDNGILTWVHDGFFQTLLGPGASLRSEPTGYEWTIGGGREGLHRIFVTQFRGRTDVILEMASSKTGRWVFLTSPSGALERAWRYTRKEKGEVSLAEARVRFEHALDLWTTKVGKVSARWPFEVKPSYDANAIFALLAAKSGAHVTEVVRPYAEDFLKLPPATEAEIALFTEAYAKLGAEADQWAYTETSRGIEDQRLTVTRVDPSRPEAERVMLLSIDGKPPTSEDVQRWRDDGGDTPKALGELPALTGLVDFKDLRIFKDEGAAVVFEFPIRDGNVEFPAERFQAHFRVNKAGRALEDIAVKLRDSFRIAGVVKVTDAGMDVHFQTLDPAVAPQPVRMKAGGGMRVLLMKVSRSFEATRTDFKRVMPFEETAVQVR